MSDVKISVIMPVYNGGKYLNESVGSVLKQQFNDFELLLIDDGSTDESGKICEELASTDSRIKVIHKENGGICSARNRGLKEAKGEYIAFCDQDDKYLPGLLSDNYKLAVDNKADIVRFKRKKIYKRADGKVETNITNLPRGITIFKERELDKQYLILRGSGFGVWSAIYRRRFLAEHGIRFNKSARYGLEDHMFNLQVYRYCQCAVLNSKVYYNWIQRDSISTTSKFDYNWVRSLFYCIKLDREAFSERGMEERNLKAWNNIVLFYLYFCFWNINRDVSRLSFVEKLRIIRILRNQSALSKGFDEKCADCASCKTDKNSQQILWHFYKKNYIMTYILLRMYGRTY